MRFEYRAKSLIRKDMKRIEEPAVVRQAKAAAVAKWAAAHKELLENEELDRLIEESIFENGCRRRLEDLEAAIRSEEE